MQYIAFLRIRPRGVQWHPPSAQQRPRPNRSALQVRVSLHNGLFSIDMPHGKMLGKKLNALRKAKGLTLKELGSAAELSASFISQVERGLTSPTVISLARIARALGVAPSYFFPAAPKHSPVVRKYARQPFQVNAGDIYYARLGSEFEGRKLEPLLTTYPPGFTNEKYAHTGEEFVYVVEGQVVFVVDGQEYALSAGDTIHYNAETPHHLENRSSAPVHLLYITTEPFLA